jgi:hypothetical protein
MRRFVMQVPLAAALLLAACYDRGGPTGPGGGGGVQLSAPTVLNSISLNGAVHLDWSDNAYTSDPNDFAYYHVFSTSYNLDQNVCGASWVTEGTTVSPTFLVGALNNGVPKCFEVTAVSLDGIESDGSPLRNDTPRPDARNVIVFTTDTLAGAQSGFRFWLDANGNTQVDVGELGLVGPAASGTNDFTVIRDSTGTYIVPQLAADSMEVYGNAAIDDLTSIDFAPVGGYTATGFEAVPLWGYVFQMHGGAFYKYGALRVSAVGKNYIIFDWSYQTDPGNPELIRVAAK